MLLGKYPSALLIFLLMAFLGQNPGNSSTIEERGALISDSGE
jgi:hypothetical protein